MTDNNDNSLRPIYVAGLKLNCLTKRQFLDIVSARIKSGIKTFAATPYSEFLYASLRSRKIRELYNKADIAIADGIGVILAERFLAGPELKGPFLMRVCQAWLELIKWCCLIILAPKTLYTTFPEKIVGADTVWDIAELCASLNLRLFLLGSKADIAARTAEKLQGRFKNLQIAGTSNADPDDSSSINQINLSKADVVLVAYGPPMQEFWIDSNLGKLSASFAMGVGGSFDYIAGEKQQPPGWVRRHGLEWLFRLLTQPYRLKRIMQATFGMMLALVRYRVFNSYPFRKNGVSVILNKEGQVLIVKRNPVSMGFYTSEPEGGFGDYWQLPQGGIDKGETLTESCLREVKEELNLTSLSLLGVSEKQYSYVWDNGMRRLFKRSWKNKGQQQKIAFFRFEGSAAEIQPDQQEVVDWKWIDFNGLLGSVHSERCGLTKLVVDELPFRISQVKSMI